MWLPPDLAMAIASVSPIDSASDSVIGYLLSYGPLGIIAVAIAYLLFRGYRLVPPGFEETVRDAARADSRADLISALDRAITEKQHAMDQRDEAMQVATEQLMPLLIQFTATTQALLPILQTVIAQGGKSLRRLGQRTVTGIMF